MERPIACVTGATGIIGARIVQKLKARNHTVRVLTRNKGYKDEKSVIYYGSLSDKGLLTDFVSGAHSLYHCAAELRDAANMREINVHGTRNIIEICQSVGVRYFCYLSSAGVIGSTNTKMVTEESECNPSNAYELTKWKAEELVRKGIAGCSIVCLRPTNVIADNTPGVISFLVRPTITSLLKTIIKGRECAHIVHAEDVAEAAIYLSSTKFESPECFIVSCDHDERNNFADIWRLFRSWDKERAIWPSSIFISVPPAVPHFFRRLLGRKSNLGCVRYSSEKLMSYGFEYAIDVRNAVKRIVEAKHEDIKRQ